MFLHNNKAGRFIVSKTHGFYLCRRSFEPHHLKSVSATSFCEDDADWSRADEHISLEGDHHGHGGNVFRHHDVSSNCEHNHGFQTFPLFSLEQSFGAIGGYYDVHLSLPLVKVDSAAYQNKVRDSVHIKQVYSKRLHTLTSLFLIIILFRST